MKDRSKEYAHRQKLRKQWMLDGKCRGCGRPDVLKSQVCQKCYLIQVSANRLGSGKFWQDILTLLEKQKFRCALTNDPISLSEDAELDHIIPSCRGGTDTLDNVRWVKHQANRMKGALTDKEFLENCQKICMVLSSKQSK